MYSHVILMAAPLSGRSHCTRNRIFLSGEPNRGRGCASSQRSADERLFCYQLLPSNVGRRRGISLNSRETSCLEQFIFNSLPTFLLRTFVYCFSSSVMKFKTQISLEIFFNGFCKMASVVIKVTTKAYLVQSLAGLHSNQCNFATKSCNRENVASHF